MSVDNDKFMERIKQIDYKLRSYSQYFAYKGGFMDADDLYQTALLKLYERYVSEPNFFSNNNSYIWCFGVWMMKNAVNHERYVWVNKVIAIETENGERPKLVNHFPRPETEAIRGEVRDIVLRTPRFYQDLYKAYAEGYETKEIAAKYKVSKWTINTRKKKMLQTLGEAWRVPPSKRIQFIRDM
jgi:DNA-directed RNA polymerase specialized sigma24 family protein